MYKLQLQFKMIRDLFSMARKQLAFPQPSDAANVNHKSVK